MRKLSAGRRFLATLPLAAALVLPGVLLPRVVLASDILLIAMVAERGPAKPPEGSLQREQRLKRIDAFRRSGKRSDLARLMPMLKDPDVHVRREAEDAIWLLWGRSGNAQVDRLFRTGVGEMARGDVTLAIDIFTRVVDLAPTFAEAWNKRATARFVAGDLAGAMEDCERALALRPDHFGSLAGYGHIYFRLDDLDMAIRYWERALAVNPNLSSVARSIEAAEKLLLRRGRLRT